MIIRNQGHPFSYDVYELTKAFLPGELLMQSNSGEAGDTSELVIQVNWAPEKKRISASLLRAGVCLREKSWPLTKDQVETAELKLHLKGCLYDLLQDLTGQQIPWGILTGVRPVKLAHQLRKDWLDREAACQILTGPYRIHPDKALLLWELAERQQPLMNRLSLNKYSLYVNIPFCPSRCAYCSFPTVLASRYQHWIAPYVDTVILEMEQLVPLLPNKTVQTVYIGGGTPTSLPIEQLARLIEAVHRIFGNDGLEEFTVEAGRPDTLHREILKMLKDLGVKRISINPQTMSDEILRRIGRQHTAQDTRQAFQLARAWGPDCINMDLIVGLPGETLDDYLRTLKEIEKFQPENLTVHTLAFKKGSAFRLAGRESLPQEAAEVEKMLAVTDAFTRQDQYLPYYLYRQKQILGNFENIGYSKPGLACLYNIATMEECQTIMGVGMAAVSKILYPGENRLERVVNFRSLTEYLNRWPELIHKKRQLLEML